MAGAPLDASISARQGRPAHSAPLATTSAAPLAALELNALNVAAIALALSLILVSVVGNCLVCVAICTDRKLRKLGNAFIVSLAIADLFVSCLVMTFALCNDLLERWLFGAVFCDVWISFDIMCCTASILNMCAISLDRFVHIKDCLFYSQWMTRRKALGGVLFVWATSATVSVVPIALGLHKPRAPDTWPAGLNYSSRLSPAELEPRAPLELAALDNGAPVRGRPDDFWPEEPAQCVMDLTPSYAVVSSSISFYIPCIIMIGLYTKLFACARRHVRNIQAVSKMPAPISSRSSSPPLGSARSLERLARRQVPVSVRLRTWLRPRDAPAHLAASAPSLAEDAATARRLGDTSGASGAHSDFAGAQSGGESMGAQSAGPEPPTAVKTVTLTTGAKTSAPAEKLSLQQSGHSNTPSGARTRPNQPLMNGPEQERLETKPNAPPEAEAEAEAEPEAEVGAEVGRQTSSARGDNRLAAHMSDGNGLEAARDKVEPRPASGPLYPGQPAINRAAINSSHRAGHSPPVTCAPDKSHLSANQWRAETSNSSGLSSSLQPRVASAGKQSQNQHPSSGQQLATHKAAITLGIIMGTFLFCWVPFFCLNIIKAFCVDCIPPSLFRLFTWLGYANSALNPIIYGVHNSEFRHAFNRIFFKHLQLRSGREYLARRFSYAPPSAEPRRPSGRHRRGSPPLSQQQASASCRESAGRPPDAETVPLRASPAF